MSQKASEEDGGVEREPWRSIFESETAGQFLFHYTPLSTAVEAILPTRQIRFSRFSNMRDPRESQWAFPSAFFGDVPGADRLYWETLSGLEEAKATVRILSLTADRGGDAGKPLFGRGFAHPRLWEQYAANHCGVCLCFHKESLTQAVGDAMQRIDGNLHHGRVQYRDGEIAPRASQFDLQTVQEQGVLEFVRAHFEEHVHELFLTKLTDWESEVEYRYLTRWEASDELFVDISQALKAVIVGSGVARQYAPTLIALGEPWGIGVARVWWRNGYPVIFKFTPPPASGNTG